MKTKTRLISLLFGFCFLGFISSSFAHIRPYQLPPGNYQQTCQSCSMHHYQLSCSCKTTMFGMMQNSSLSVPKSCRYVENENGNLQCTRYKNRHHHYWHPHPSHHYNRLPPGNYNQSCNSCSMHHNVLHCICKDGAGFPQNTQLKIHRHCQYIQNLNGQLQCTGR